VKNTRTQTDHSRTSDKASLFGDLGARFDSHLYGALLRIPPLTWELHSYFIFPARRAMLAMDAGLYLVFGTTIPATNDNHRNVKDDITALTVLRGILHMVPPISASISGRYATYIVGPPS
jgi:hypothetical protein